MNSWYNCSPGINFLRKFCLTIGAVLFLWASGDNVISAQQERELIVNRPSQMSHSAEIAAETIISLDGFRSRFAVDLSAFAKISETGEVVYKRQVFGEGNWQDEARELLYVDGAGRPIEFRYQWYIDDAWENVARDLADYEGNDLWPSVVTYQDWHEGDWLNDEREFLTVGDGGRLLEWVIEVWEDDEWIPEEWVTISYTDIGDFAEMVEYYYDDEWVPDFRLTWTRDDQGNQIELLEETHDGHEWVPYWRMVSEYENGNKVLDLTEYYDDLDEEWLPAARTILEYENGNNTVRTTQDYDIFEEEWVNIFRRLGTFDATGLETETVNQGWDDDEEEWRNSSRLQYEYTPEGLESLRTRSFWVGEDWMYSNRTANEYNNDGELIVRTESMWIGTEWEYTTRHLYTPGDPTPVADNRDLPVQFELMQNYPNPFNPETTIRFSIPELSEVNLVVYDILGRTVATLVDEQLQPGEYSLVFDASRLASGVYMYQLRAGDHVETKRLILMK